MNTASLELCKELYELSGWEDTHGYWNGKYDVEFNGQASYGDVLYADYSVRQTDPKQAEMFDDYPAYDLGYLLRRLPAAIDNAPLILQTDGTGVVEEIYWCAYYDATPVTYKTSYDDTTPEDAACKLAIELFKAGVLQK